MLPKQAVVDLLKHAPTFAKNSTVRWDLIHSFDRSLYAASEASLIGHGEDLANWQATFSALTLSAQQAAIQIALDRWGAMLGITFARADSANPASIRFGAADLKNNGYKLDLSPGPDNPKFDIFIDSVRPDDANARFRNPVEGSKYFSTLVHEIGHAFGLKDLTDPIDENSDKFSIMSQGGLAAYAKRAGPNTPQMYDVEAIRQLYGISMNAGDNTRHLFDHQARTSAYDNTAFDDGGVFHGIKVSTIVDTGGTGDWIDARTLRNVKINLEPGTFSTIGSVLPFGRDNVGIAFYTIIEDAKGGPGADIIKGNIVANVLDGGGGNDRLEGGGGNDTLIGGLDRDIYVVGQGQDTIVDQDGRGLLLNEAGRPIGGVFTRNGSQYVSAADASIYATLNSPLTIHLPNGASAVVDNFDADDLGIRLVQLIGARGYPGSAYTGTDLPEYLQADAGGSLLNGLGAGDYLAGNAGNDRLLGGYGDDYLSGNLGDNWIEGGPDRDVIVLGAGNDYADGGDGEDFIVNFGKDIYPVGLPAIANWAIYYGIPFSWLPPVIGPNAAGDQDLLAFRAGFGYLAEIPLPDFTQFVLKTTFGVVLGQEVHGGADGDVVVAGPGDDLIYGDAGSDTLLGGLGNDAVFGGNENDRLYGNVGTDYLYGDGGDDLARGEAGDDHLFGSIGDDDLDGDSDFIAYERHGSDVIDGGIGNDTIKGNGGADMLFGGDGADTMAGDGSGVEPQFQLADYMDGEAGNDALYGGGGDDELFGGAGLDTLHGEAGDDALDGGTEGDQIYGEEGEDAVFGGAGDDWIHAGGGVDFVDGGDGIDRIWGEAGNDVLYGASGDDHIDMGDGDDTADGGSGVDWLYGMAGDDILRGGDGNDRLWDDGGIFSPGSGNDVLDGGPGDDGLDGGVGSDTYLFGPGGGRDSISQDDAAPGSVDRVLFDARIMPGDVHVSRSTDRVDLVFKIGDGTDSIRISYYFGLNAEEQGFRVDQIVFAADNTIWTDADLRPMLLNGTDAAETLYGFETDDVMHGGGGNDVMDAFEGNDTVYGDNGNDIVAGGDDEDFVYGGEGDDQLFGADPHGWGFWQYNDDFLDGGPGADSMFGNFGNDTYIVDNAGDTVTEIVGAGHDAVQSSVAHTLAANVEMLTLTGTVALAGNGNELNNTLVGNAANNVLQGLAGDDYLQARDGNDTLQGGAGSDGLEGGAGVDVLDGGTGNDYAKYTYAPAAVVVSLEQAALNGAHAAGDSFISIEGLVGSAFADQLHGNALDNDLAGFDGNDTIFGRDGNDNLQGMNGNDTLDGGAGSDVLKGGAGDDLYLVDIGDSVYEISNEGYDTVQSAIGFTLTPGVEMLMLIGTAALGGAGNDLDNTLVGNAANNLLQGLGGSDSLQARDGNDTLQGGAGSDTLEGGAGNDVLEGGDGNDYAKYSYAGAAVTASLEQPSQNTADAQGDSYSSIEGLIGSAFADRLYGNGLDNDIAGADGDDTVFGRDGNDNLQGMSGDDTLDGDAGADVLKGGAGDDVYIVDTSDTVVELANEGNDTIHSSTAYTLGANVEILKLFGAAAIGGFGNELNNTLVGNAGANVLQGLAGTDYLQARDGNDTLQGGAGSDNLEGGAGMDLLDGGDGYDYAKYYYSSAGVTVDLQQPAQNTSDAAGDSYVSIEGLIGSLLGDGLRGDAADNDLAGYDGNDTLVGRGGSDNLQGMNGDDVLHGGAGADVLRGGAGSDRFVYYAITEGTDAIVDFVTGAGGDRLDVRSVLTGYSAGASNAASFVRVTASGGSTILGVNADGVGTDFVDLAVIQGLTGLQVSTMLAQGNLLMA